MIARALNSGAVARFSAYLARLRQRCIENPPRELLEDSASTTELSVEIAIADQPFPSRRALGDHLCKLLAPMPHEELEQSTGLWTWLSLYWFDQLCPQREDGTRRPGNDYRHIPDFGRYRYRHLLYGPYHVYRRHGPLSVVLLSGPVHADSHLYQAITGRQDLIANRGVIEAALLLYVDRRIAGLKRGCQPSRPHPGTIRRFVNVLQQLDLTFDIYGMTGRQIVDLLPPEFDPWRPAEGKRTTATRHRSEKTRESAES